MIDAVRQMTPCVVVDMPHAWTPWVRQTLLAADDIVIVATPDLASLRNAKNLSICCKQNRPNDRAAAAWCSIRSACPSGRKFR